MANICNEIGEIIKKVKILLLDIEGTTTSISFVKDKLFPYAEENVKKFLETQWESENVKEVVVALRNLALEDKEKSVEGLVAIPGEDASKEDQIEGLVNNVKWQMSNDRKVGALKQLQGLIWKQGYDNGDIKGHVYDDVSPALEQWRSVEGQKVYIYSSGSVQAQKLLFAQSLAGDLLKFIDGHFDTAVGAKQEPASYTKIVEEIGCKPEEILFLTDIVKEAEAARSAGLHTALLSREGNAPLPDDIADKFPVLHSFAQLAVTNKRKPDDQVPEVPAKIPKTDVEIDIKSSSINEPSTKAENDNTEEMDVEENVSDKNEEPKLEEAPNTTKVETVVEEITDSNEPLDVPVVEAVPIVIEDKTENTDNNKMDIVDDATSEKPVKNNVEETPVAEKSPGVEETPPTVVTEIEDVTGDVKALEEVAEIIEDLVPVVEEPQNTEAEMEELQNVGDVLEKECDEILSKVQDVTNLDSIIVKPLLNSIAEETMDTDNLDSNDVVERILDTELELEMKQCADIDLNTVTELTEEKKLDDNCIIEENDVSKKTASDENPTKQMEKSDMNTMETIEKVEDKATESPIETSVVEDTKSVVSSNIKDKETVSEVNPVEQTSADVPKETNGDEQKKESGIAEEPQTNGNSTNGNKDAINGDDSKDEELSLRLGSENGKETINGTNGNSNSSEEALTENKADTEVSEIKVKSVAASETINEPLEQTTEA